MDYMENWNNNFQRAMKYVNDLKRELVKNNMLSEEVAKSITTESIRNKAHSSGVVELFTANNTYIFNLIHKDSMHKVPNISPNDFIHFGDFFIAIFSRDFNNYINTPPMSAMSGKYMADFLKYGISFLEDKYVYVITSYPKMSLDAGRLIIAKDATEVKRIMKSENMTFVSSEKCTLPSNPEALSCKYGMKYMNQPDNYQIWYCKIPIDANTADLCVRKYKAMEYFKLRK